MKIDGQILKFKTPARVADIIKDYPDYVLMDSEAVRHLGVRAKVLAADHELKPRRLYFLVQLPKAKDEKVPRRARSGVLKMSAKDRLESLMLSRRSVSDLTHLKLMAPALVDDESGEGTGGAVRVKMRLPKAQVTKLMEESKDAAEVAEKIIDLCIGDAGEDGAPKEDGGLLMQQRQWKPALGSIQEMQKTREVLRNFQGKKKKKKTELW